jgi:hypothetical protein
MTEQFTFNKRLVFETLAHYQDTFLALCELVNNSIQAEADRIELQVDYAPRDAVSVSDTNKIIVRDNGVGVSKGEFKTKILQVATKAKQGGRGIGRFAPLQIGSRLQIETVAFDQKEKAFFKSLLVLDTNEWRAECLDEISLKITYVPMKGKQDSYYEVTITDLYGAEVTANEKHKRIHKSLHEGNLGAALFAQYPERIFQGDVEFIVNGKVLKADDFVVGPIVKEHQEFTDLAGDKHPLDYTFIQVKAFGKHRAFLRVSNNILKSVAHTFEYHADIPEPNQWFVLVDSPHFDENADVFRNLNIYELDQSSEHLVDEIRNHIDSFFSQKYEQYKAFVQKLKADSSYPYRKQQASSETRSTVFNQLAYYLEEKHRLLAGKETIRELVYALMDRAMDTREFEFLLSEAIKLDDESLARFKSLMERADFDDVITFSAEVARKQQVLDFLHKLNYSETAKWVKERKELHKIVEKHLWLFGEQYNGTPKLFSDKSLENALKALRQQLFAYEPAAEDDNLLEIEDAATNDITDLFFFNENIVSDHTREIMVVELKAPRVRISEKELAQARRYAFHIETKGIFPKGHNYKIILIGAELSGLAKSQCTDEKNPFLFHKSKIINLEAWAVEWSDIVARNKQKLSFLGNALDTKDKDAKAMIETEFKGMNLNRLKSKLSTVAPKKHRGRRVVAT